MSRVVFAFILISLFFSVCSLFLGVFALFFFDEVPRVREDILRKVPIIGNYFVREIPDEDNPF